MAKLDQLLEQGASINSCCGLHWAAGQAKYGSDWSSACMGRLLKEPTCDVDHRDEFGHSPLHIAASVRSEAACRVLLDAGADPLLRTSDAMTDNGRALEVNQDNVRIDLQSMEEFLLCHGTGYDRTTNKPKSVKQALEEHAAQQRPCTELLEKATASRLAQLGLAETLIKALMYSRTLSSDGIALRLIHKAVKPLPTSHYAWT